jgi:CheY-like chemotaxis protein
MSKVLIIDDHNGIRDLLLTVVQSQGHEASVAADGLAGLQQFLSDHPDLVIVDLKMPEMDGLEVVRTLRREQPGVPIIAMSGGFGEHTDLYLDVAVEFGAVAALRKPFRLATFKQAVAEALAHAGPVTSSREPFAVVPGQTAG